MKEIPVTQIEGFAIGQAEDLENGTGCTAIIAEHGAIAGMDVRGGGPATRDSDLLKPENTMQEINGVLLSGGSAYGLGAATGVMEYLSEKHVGFSVGDIRVPIVVQADIFDLSVGNPVWPDAAMGYAAAKNSEENQFRPGNFGAGTGASVGKVLGEQFAMKSGQGSYALQLGDLQVGAIAVVNACGDVFEADSKTPLAGAFDRTSKQFLIAEQAMLSQKIDPSALNTTISCILTNAKLSKAQLSKIASIAHDAYARTIHPCHMSTDGDTIFAMSSECCDALFDQVAVLAVQVLMKAIENAVSSAQSAYGLPGAASQKASQ